MFKETKTFKNEVLWIEEKQYKRQVNRGRREGERRFGDTG